MPICASGVCKKNFEIGKFDWQIYCSSRCANRETKRRYWARFPDKWKAQRKRQRDSQRARSYEFCVRCRASLATLGFLKETAAKSDQFAEAVIGLPRLEFQLLFACAAGFEIDHVVPLSAFDFSKPEHIVRACFWKNIQVLSEAENLAKSDSHSCADVMSLPWAETKKALAMARRFCTKPDERWKRVDWKMSDAAIVEFWGFTHSTVRTMRYKARNQRKAENNGNVPLADRIAAGEA